LVRIDGENGNNAIHQTMSPEYPSAWMHGFVVKTVKIDGGGN
jgi:hypothetical protein